MRPLLILLVMLVGAPVYAHSRPLRSDDAQTVYLRGRLRTLVGCFALAGDSARSKGHLSVEVQPVGEVSDVVLEGPIPATMVSCVAARVRAWRFPPFDGQARRLRYSLVFVGADR